jgi:predicted dehydrogenase
VTATRPLRIAIVGAGLMGRWHAHAAVRAGAHVSAIVDPDQDRARTLSGHHPGARLVASMADVLPDVDVVHICTPSRTHVSLVTQALDAGRHVLIEKPVAPSTDVVASLLASAASRGVLLCPVHQFPFQAGFQRAIARLPGVGPLRQVSYLTCSAGADPHDAAAMSQVAAEILPHPLSVMARCVAHIDQVDWAVRAPAPGEIRALGQADGVGLSITISMNGRPTTNVVELIGAHGTTTVDLFHGFAVTLDGRVSRVRKAAKPLTAAVATAVAATTNLAGRAWRGEPAYPGLRHLTTLFYEAVRRGGASPVPPDETLAVARAGDRILGALVAEGR